MDFTRKSLFLSLLLAILTERAHSQASGLVDETVIQGEDITLKCQASKDDDLVEWRVFSESDPIFDSINGVKDPNKYDRPGSGLDYSLTVKNTVWGDGGQYSCSAFGSAAVEAQLVVLGQPSASFGTLIEGQTAQLRCDVTTASDSRTNLKEIHYPTLRAYIDGVLQEDIIHDWKDDGPGQDSPIVLTVNYTATTGHHDKNFKCEAYTQQPDVKVSASKLMEIHSPVRDMVLAPRKQEYEVDAYINCTAQGHPEPTISWNALDSAGSRPVSGGQLIITQDMLGNNGFNRWECQAINQYVTEAIKEEIEFTVVEGDGPDDGDSTGGSGSKLTKKEETLQREPSHHKAALSSHYHQGSGGGGDTAAIAAGVVIPLILIIIIAIVVFILWRRRNKSGDKSKKPPEPAYPGPESEGVNPSVTMHPNPGMTPANQNVPAGYHGYTGPGAPPAPAGRDSPGYGDLGIKHMNGTPNISFDDSFVDEKPTQRPSGPAYSNQVYTPSPKGSTQDISLAGDGGTAV